MEGISEVESLETRSLTQSSKSVKTLPPTPRGTLQRSKTDSPKPLPKPPSKPTPPPKKRVSIPTENKETTNESNDTEKSNLKDNTTTDTEQPQIPQAQESGSDLLDDLLLDVSMSPRDTPKMVPGEPDSIVQNGSEKLTTPEKEQINNNETTSNSNVVLPPISEDEPDNSVSNPPEQNTEEVRESRPVKRSMSVLPAKILDRLGISQSDVNQPQDTTNPVTTPRRATLVRSATSAKPPLISITEEEFNKKYPHKIVDFSESWTQRRDRIAYEILTTEVTYVKTLQVAIEIFLEPLKKEESELSQSLQKIEKTLRALGDILNINVQLLDGLKERFESWSDTQTIGDLLFRITPFLKLYSLYTEAYDETIVVAREAEAKERFFINLLEAAKAHPLSKGQILTSFLITPIQRIPRYVMLLTDLIKNTEETHPDYEKLEQSLTKMKSVADHINEAINVAENRAKCVEIQKNLGLQNIVAPHRKYVSDGILIKQCRKEKKARSFYLFSDLLMYGFNAPATGKFIVSGQMKLENLSVADLDNQQATGPNCLQLTGPGKSFYVFADTPEAKTKWLKLLNDAISDHVGKKSTLKLNDSNTQTEAAPIWQPDDAVQSCHTCKSKFTMFNRRHHCRNCGKCICGNCSKQSCLVKAVHSKLPVRVCDPCFDMITGGKPPQ
eukprot:TRINITY_DN4840_c0_g1_i1.p1 TRINITY_DN4840_c0_g1~~TRINITY_DN4840_c0_g1_i1.p1  ORF type:complete len:669 (+),score=114.17 TRINITY_DN4840_c0_g1_i1:138-2144(+)